MTAMDPLSHLLAGPRAREAFWLRCLLRAPWAIRLEDRSPVSLTVVTRGRAWLVHDDGEQVLLEEGDLALERPGDDAGCWRLCDDPATPVDVVILPGQHCVAPDGRSLTSEMTLGRRTWGNSLDVGPDGAVLLTGAYELESAVGRRLLSALPRLAVVRAGDVSPALITLVADELAREAPGQDVVLDRLLDLVLVSVVRAWAADEETLESAWFRTARDPLVADAVRLLLDAPAHPWSADSLAAAVGCSRATLARRFTTALGVAPMAYLTHWRLSLAADLLRSGDLTLAAVAERVGYATPFALSSAFKRHHGESPQDYRRAARPAAG